MRKVIASISLLFAVSAIALAIPARPGSRNVRQPDGTTITLTLHGDEYCHWVTDANGTIVEKGEDGFWRPSGKTVPQHRTALGRRNIGLRAKWSSYDTAPETNFGDRKILAILVNFTDSTFVIDDPRTRFDNLLNQPGYSENGGHGSVRDYYIENSRGLYRPQFDVYGPVNLTHSSAYYDQTSSVAAALKEACAQLDDDVNFADYDTDSDGRIDMILLYYAGHNEAEGAGEESIWPHQSTGTGSFDGVNIGNYFCTSELSGADGKNMCGIGTTTHEFAHSLGLPDFYDTDYEKNGGYNGATNWFDVMCNGSYLDSGKCPPYFSATERNMLGWMPDLEVLSESGAITLAPVQENAAYKVLTENEGEYFVLEARSSEGWDSALPDNGLLVYHVDKSQNTVGGNTAAYLWESTNRINAFFGHPCYYVMTDTGGLPEVGQWRNMCLGGMYAGNSLSINNWASDPIGLEIREAAFSNGNMVFQAVFSGSKFFGGLVRDTSGLPLEGVQVVLSKSAYPFAGAPSLLPTDLVTTTDYNGEYSFDVSSLTAKDYVISFRKDGYITFTENVSFTEPFQCHYVTMFAEGEGAHADLYKVNSSGSLTYGGLGAGSFAVAMRYTADEIAQGGYAGARINSIEMAVSECTFSEAYLLVYFGAEKALNAKVEITKFNAIASYDISSYDIVIPEGKDVYIGYGLTDVISGEYPFYMRANGGTSSGGNFARKNFNTGSPSAWKTPWAQYDFMIYADIEFPAPAETVASHDVAFVGLEEGVPVAVPSAGKTLKETIWYLDGAAVDTPPAVSSLSSGLHTYKAVMHYFDGTSETVWFDVSGE